MIETRPTRETTRLLLGKIADEFNAAANAVAQAAIRDGEAPVGAKLNLSTNPPAWLIETPDIQPPNQPEGPAA